jgi:hypothetical protein
MLPNFALERSGKGLARGAAGAPYIVAPAAPVMRLARPAQRWRYTALSPRIDRA